MNALTCAGRTSTSASVLALSGRLSVASSAGPFTCSRSMPCCSASAWTAACASRTRACRSIGTAVMDPRIEVGARPNAKHHVLRLIDL